MIKIKQYNLDGHGSPGESMKSSNVSAKFRHNETFYIDKIRFYPENTLRIYNRWGSLVYEAYGYNNEWAGTRDGELLPVGTYYYVLDLGDGAGSSYEGYITLLRP